jgi:hypothetical protein
MSSRRRPQRCKFSRWTAFSALSSTGDYPRSSLSTGTMVGRQALCLFSAVTTDAATHEYKAYEGSSAMGRGGDRIRGEEGRTDAG